VLTVISTTTRPSTSISWFSDTPDGAIIQNITNALIVNKTNTIGADGLSRENTLTFDSYENYLLYISKVNEIDATLLLRRNEYIIANGMTLKIEEKIDNGQPLLEKQL